MTITGGCGCGAVRFEVDAPFLSASYCHCTRCQRRSGAAASANAQAAPGSFRIVSGQEHLREWAPDDGAAKIFCGICGSAVHSRVGDRVGVRLGAVDGDPGIRPELRQYVASAATWEPLPDDGLPRHPQGMPPA